MQFGVRYGREPVGAAVLGGALELQQALAARAGAREARVAVPMRGAGPRRFEPEPAEHGIVRVAGLVALAGLDVGAPDGLRAMRVVERGQLARRALQAFAQGGLLERKPGQPVVDRLAERVLVGVAQGRGQGG